MADGGQNFSVLQDLQVHLRTAKVPLDKLSTLAQEGDERVGFFIQNMLVSIRPS